MKAAEILRKLADLVDTIESDGSPTEPASTDTGVMVPPLQQKIELLKKSQGMDNVYDQQEENKDLEHIKKNAGIITVTTAEEDEPFEG